MKIGVGLLLILVAVGLIVVLGIGGCNSWYKYSKNIGSYWELADKSSTIEAKSENIDAFVKAIKSEKFAENNAIIFRTPDNSFANNLKALETLQKRLQDIKKIKPDSFEYNQAIQQITAQEQGEATKMLDVIHQCWILENYWYLWDWLLFISIIVIVLLIVIGGVLINAGVNE